MIFDLSNQVYSYMSKNGHTEESSKRISYEILFIWGSTNELGTGKQAAESFQLFGVHISLGQLVLCVC